MTMISICGKPICGDRRSWLLFRSILFAGLVLFAARSVAVARPTAVTKLANGYELHADKDDEFENRIIAVVQKKGPSKDFSRVIIGLVDTLDKISGHRAPKLFVDVSPLPRPYQITDLKRAGGGDFDFVRVGDFDGRTSETAMTLLGEGDLDSLRSGHPLKFKIVAVCPRGYCAHIGQLDPSALEALDTWAAAHTR